MKKILSGLLVVIMLISSLLVSAASFTDIKEGDWYYEAVTEMTEKGLFKGKGDNLFCPNDTMTKAEFLAVTMRIICPDANLKAEEGQAWWQPYYNLAKAEEIILENEFPLDSIENCINREEMAYISSMAFFAQKDGNPDDKEYKDTVLMATQVSLSAHNSQEYGFDLRNTIPDYDEIGEDYKAYVVAAHMTGLLGGVDDKGTFAPKNTLTRAEGATVLYRLINKDKRLNKSTSNGEQTETDETEDLSQPITIYEGQARYNRNAKEGDLFIKKDGTQIVLKKGPNGILGEGQGVAPDVGLFGIIGENGLQFFSYKVADYGQLIDSTGTTIQNQTYWVNATTGEGYWSKEYQKLRENISEPNRDGTYEGEVSEDAYHLYVWYAGMWMQNVKVIK